MRENNPRFQSIVGWWYALPRLVFCASLSLIGGCGDELADDGRRLGEAEKASAGERCAPGCVWSSYAVSLGVQSEEARCDGQACACVTDGDIYSSCQGSGSGGDQIPSDSAGSGGGGPAGGTCAPGCVWSTYAVSSGAQSSTGLCDGQGCACVVRGDIYARCDAGGGGGGAGGGTSGSGSGVGAGPRRVRFGASKEVMVGVTEASGHSARERAFLDMIAAAEGTSVMNNPCGQAAYGYQSLFECYRYSSRRFSNYRDHPRLAFQTGWGSYTDAAGRYQFLSTTWDEIVRAERLPDFSPAQQDRAALNRLRARGSIGYIAQTSLGASPDSAFKRAVDASACEWASLPAIYGSSNHYVTTQGLPSCHGQVVYPFEDLYQVFRAAYESYAGR